MSKNQRKRVDVVTVRLEKMELVKESSFLYESDGERRIVSTPRQAFDLVKDMFKGADREIMIAAYLNTKNEPLAISKISIGSLNSAVIHPREIFKAAILANSASFILYHNHPSGNVNPSKEDIEITKRIKKAGEIIGIDLVDHLVVYSEDNNYLSMRENQYI
ncbi:JAB domain-containing protein [Paramaledivibacter caminithermalis]|jgi:DNA repair protein RadC|uniref:DNA repair protein RadC n=1 Tax=Paramaledivibacter caminithermalis (strain DSM 15212 / CIP 107654 / DViRD3) TaxID=1121301 RepID=A0A1M6NAT0_PARC5|nr:JAB domain-containing protein [Paramaledivibacter caminithermalis]SHJ92794.1 DNA repair protein RadC [Paramaledivibacter caminithermalis DSM 15212]